MEVAERDMAGDTEVVAWRFEERLELIESERRFCGVGLRYVTTDEDLTEGGVGAGVIVRGCKEGVDWRDGMGVIRRGLAVDTECLGVLWSCDTAECRRSKPISLAFRARSRKGAGTGGEGGDPIITGSAPMSSPYLSQKLSPACKSL